MPSMMRPGHSFHEASYSVIDVKNMTILDRMKQEKQNGPAPIKASFMVQNEKQIKEDPREYQEEPKQDQAKPEQPKPKFTY